LSTNVKLVAEEKSALVLVKARDEVVQSIRSALGDAVKESRQVTFNGDSVLSLRIEYANLARALTSLVATSGIASIVVRLE
jgi:hypothetical protein